MRSSSALAPMALLAIPSDPLLVCKGGIPTSGLRVPTKKLNPSKLQKCVACQE